MSHRFNLHALLQLSPLSLLSLSLLTLACDRCRGNRVFGCLSYTSSSSFGSGSRAEAKVCFTSIALNQHQPPRPISVRDVIRFGDIFSSSLAAALSWLPNCLALRDNLGGGGEYDETDEGWEAIGKTSAVVAILMICRTNCDRTKWFEWSCKLCPKFFPIVPFPCFTPTTVSLNLGSILIAFVVCVLLRLVLLAYDMMYII